MVLYALISGAQARDGLSNGWAALLGCAQAIGFSVQKVHSLRNPRQERVAEGVPPGSRSRP